MKDTWSLLLSSVSLRVCYFLSEDWANCFTLEHNSRRPMDVCFAFILPQMASVLIMVSGLTIIIMHIHLAWSQEKYVAQTQDTYHVWAKKQFSHFFSSSTCSVARFSLSSKVTRCLAEKRRGKNWSMSIEQNDVLNKSQGRTRTPTRIHQYLNKYIAFEFSTKIVQI